MITQLSSRRISLRILFLVVWVGILLSTMPSLAQQAYPQIQIQLPTTRIFQINTVVSAPDGGVMSLGGLSRSRYGSTTRGIPFVGGLPGSGRPDINRYRGGGQASGFKSVRVQIISNREISDDLMAEAARRELTRDTIDPNGSAEVQRLADLLTRNIGRNK